MTVPRMLGFGRAEEHPTKSPSQKVLNDVLSYLGDLSREEFCVLKEAVFAARGCDFARLSLGAPLTAHRTSIPERPPGAPNLMQQKLVRKR